MRVITLEIPDGYFKIEYLAEGDSLEHLDYDDEIVKVRYFHNFPFKESELSDIEKFIRNAYFNYREQIEDVINSIIQENKEFYDSFNIDMTVIERTTSYTRNGNPPMIYNYSMKGCVQIKLKDSLG